MTEMTVPWPSVLQELSLARTLSEFADTLEQLTMQLCVAPSVLYYRSRPNELYCPARPESTLPLEDDNFVGACLLNCEILHAPPEKLMLPVEAASAVAVPVKLYGRPVGALLIVDAAEPMSETELAELGQLASLVQESVERQEELAAFTRTNEDLLVRSVDLRQGAGHVGRVAQLATEIAGMMDLSAQTRQRLWRAAQYHDVGMLLVTDQNTADQVRYHSKASAEYCTDSRVLADLAPLVAAHHERYDGSGFPRGLAGDQAPAEAWVLALAEHLEEFRSERSGAAVPTIVEEFFAGPAKSHLPAAVDALGGLLVSGRLEQLLH